MKKGAGPVLFAIVAVAVIVTALTVYILGGVLKDYATVTTSVDQINSIDLKYKIDAEKLFLENFIWVGFEKSTYDSINRSMFSKANYDRSQKISNVPLWRVDDSLNLPTKSEVVNDTFSPVNRSLETFRGGSLLSNFSLFVEDKPSGYDTITSMDVRAGYNSNNMDVLFFGKENVTRDYTNRHFYIFSSATSFAQNSRSIADRAFEEAVESFGVQNPRCGEGPGEIDSEVLAQRFEMKLEEKLEMMYPGLDIDIEMVDYDISSDVIIDGECAS